MTDEQIIEIVGPATFLPDFKVQEVLDAFRVAGLAVVPVEPTKAMEAAGWDALEDDDCPENMWNAMIAAATNLG
jgi:hypothetical protein